MGTLALKQDDFIEAETRYRRSLISIESRLGTEHPRAMNAHWGLAEAVLGQGRYTDARSAVDEAMRIGAQANVGLGSLVRPRVLRAQILIEGKLDLEAGRAEALQALRDVEKHAPGLEDVAAEARELLDQTRSLSNPIAQESVAVEEDPPSTSPG